MCGNLTVEPSPDSHVLKLAALPLIDQILPISLESLITTRLDIEVMGTQCQTPGPCFGYNLPANRTVYTPGQIFIVEVICLDYMAKDNLQHSILSSKLHAIATKQQ